MMINNLKLFYKINIIFINEKMKIVTKKWCKHSLANKFVKHVSGLSKKIDQKKRKSLHNENMEVWLII